MGRHLRVPPVLRIYVDEAECPGEGGWNEIEGGGGGATPIDPTPDDGNHSITPGVSGAGTQADPYVLAAEEVNFGGSTGSNEVITFTGQTVGALVQFTDLNSGTNGARFTQPVGVVDANGTYSTNLKFSDSPNSNTETVYDGLIRVGEIYIKWEVTATPVPVDPPEVTQTPVISTITTTPTNQSRSTPALPSPTHLLPAASGLRTTPKSLERPAPAAIPQPKLAHISSAKSSLVRTTQLSKLTATSW